MPPCACGAVLVSGTFERADRYFALNFPMLHLAQDWNPFATEKTIREDMAFLRAYNTHRGDDSTSPGPGDQPSPDP